MKLIRVMTLFSIVLLPFTATANAAMSSTSVITLTVSASASNMPMSGNSQMTSTMSGSAKGTFTLNLSKNTFCYTVTSKGLKNITEAHVQFTSTEKDVVLMNVNKINMSGATCIKVNHQIMTGLASHPARYSFMIHTKADPEGAVMGNLKTRK